jgi:hypothetical protein
VTAADPAEPGAREPRRYLRVQLLKSSENDSIGTLSEPPPDL